MKKSTMNKIKELIGDYGEDFEFGIYMTKYMTLRLGATFKTYETIDFDKNFKDFIKLLSNKNKNDIQPRK